MVTGRRPGRPSKPTERKRRSGNPGHRPLPEPVQILPATDGPPTPPESLKDAGRALWEAVWRDGAGWLAPSDTLAVRMLTETFDELEAVRADLVQEGRTFVTEKGYRGPHPLLAHERALAAQLVTLLSVLGFTPTDRARLGLAEVKRMSGLAEVLEMRRKLRGEE
jgi:P27 family predicted phage terminase small subunit